jgi:TolB-like protein
MRKFFEVTIIVLLVFGFVDRTNGEVTRPACAVLTVESKGGLTAEESSLFSDRLAVDLGNCRQYAVLDRQRMKDILREQITIGRVADENSGLVECGRLLQARYVVHGSIGKVDSSWTVNIYIVDVETALRVKQATVDMSGSKEEVLPAISRKVIESLLGVALVGGKSDKKAIDLDESVSMELAWVPSVGVWMGIYEVTCGQYLAFVRQSGYDGKGDADRGYLKHMRGKDDTPAVSNYPVVWISYENTEAFCKWLSKKTGSTCRLPMEKEWEAACRGSSAATFPWGEDSSRAGEYAWYSGNATSLMPVGGRRSNQCGLYDMAGNVWEYCAGWYDIDKRSHPVRGGSWFGDAAYLAVAIRQPFKNRQTWNNVGFRVVLCP